MEKETQPENDFYSAEILPKDLSKVLHDDLSAKGFSHNRKISDKIALRLLLRPVDLATTTYRSATHLSPEDRHLTIKERNAYIQELMILENVLITNGTFFLGSGLTMLLAGWMTNVSGVWHVGMSSILVWSLIAFRRYLFRKW